MHEPYDNDEEDDGYDDDQYNNDYPNNPYKWYYKFDVGPDSPISNWLSDMMNYWIGPNAFDSINHTWEIIPIPGFSNTKFPVSSWNPNTGKGHSFQYLGSNYQGSPMWKSKYFVLDPINVHYKLHIQAHAKHFVQQPTYYKGLFDILN